MGKRETSSGWVGGWVGGWVWEKDREGGGGGGVEMGVRGRPVGGRNGRSVRCSVRRGKAVGCPSEVEPPVSSTISGDIARPLGPTAAGRAATRLRAALCPETGHVCRAQTQSRGLFSGAAGASQGRHNRHARGPIWLDDFLLTTRGGRGGWRARKCLSAPPWTATVCVE